MTKQLYLGYNKFTSSAYLNTGGRDVSSGSDFQHNIKSPIDGNDDPSGCVPDLIQYLENNYTGRKARIISELPIRQSSLLETMIMRSSKLKKMSFELPDML